MRFPSRSDLRDDARRALLAWIDAQVDQEGNDESVHSYPLARPYEDQQKAMARSAFVQDLASSVLSEVELRLAETKSRRELSAAISQLVESLRARSRPEGEK